MNARVLARDHVRAAARGIVAGVTATVVVAGVMGGVTVWAATCVFPGSVLGGIWYAWEVYQTEAEAGKYRTWEGRP